MHSLCVILCAWSISILCFLVLSALFAGFFFFLLSHWVSLYAVFVAPPHPGFCSHHTLRIWPTACKAEEIAQWHSQNVIFCCTLMMHHEVLLLIQSKQYLEKVIISIILQFKDKPDGDILWLPTLLSGRRSLELSCGLSSERPACPQSHYPPVQKFSFILLSALGEHVWMDERLQPPSPGAH